ncbi:extracellular solute-binding protein [Paenibacillus sp. GCM10027626]|uniref:extracellular solute-binding protein n=1 Tax=Paenibacillus sp. GCM10027626 TaxID=3273411 RepID=UPI003632ABBA
MKKVKGLLTVSLIFAIVSTLAACSSGNNGGNKSLNNNSPADTGKSGSENKESVSNEKEPEEAAIDLGGRTIRIAAWWDERPQPEMKDELARIDEVEKKYNVKFEFLNVPREEYLSKFTTTVLAGEPFADIVWLGYNWALPAALNGQLLKAEEFTSPENDINTSNEIIAKGEQILGADYSFIPVSAGGGGLAYNRDLFKKLGLPDLHEVVAQGEWTWDKMLEIAKQATQDTNNDGKNDTWGLSGWTDEMGLFLIASNGGQIMDASAGKQTLDDPKTVEAFEFMNKIYNEDKVVKSKTGNFTDYSESGAFADGDVAMAYAWDWMANQYTNFDFGLVPFPKGPQGKEFTYPSYESSWFIPKGVKDPKIVYKLYEEIKTLPKLEDYPGQTWLEKMFKHQEDIDTLLSLAGKKAPQFYYAIDKYPYGNVVYETIKDRKSVSSTIEKYKQQAQDAIDTVYKQAK